MAGIIHDAEVRYSGTRRPLAPRAGAGAPVTSRPGVPGLRGPR